MTQDITTYLFDKVQEIDNKINELQKQKEFIKQMARDLQSEVTPQAPINSEYDPQLTTGDLILEILKKENHKMKSRKIFQILHTVKPEISLGGFRTRLARLIKKDRVKHNKKFEYWVE